MPFLEKCLAYCNDITNGVTLMKILSFFLGAGSSLAYALFGGMMFYTDIFNGIRMDHWMFIVSLVGIAYLFLQMLQVITMKSGGVKEASKDFFLSIIPAGIFLLGIFTGETDLKEAIIYGGFILLDGVLLVLVLRMLSMSTEITPGK